MTRRLFPNPFSGRPKPVALVSHFLLSPEVFLKLLGTPMSTTWRELGKESLIKSMEYHRRRGQPLPDRLCTELLAAIPAASGMREPFQRAFDDARGGDERAMNALLARGEWATFLDGYHTGATIHTYSYANRYVVALEAALAEPVRLIREGDFRQATRVLEGAELTAPLLCPDMASALAAVTSDSHLVPVQWAVTLETALSQLAAFNAGLKGRVGDESVGDISPLFEGPAGRRGTPGPQFCRFLMRATNQKSMMALSNRLSDQREPRRVDVSVETLKRWSAGKTLPESGLIKLIVKKCCPEHEERILILHWATRYLTLLGFVTERLLASMARSIHVPGAAERFAPWPTFPFGCDRFQSWCQQRYPFWNRYHQRRLAVGEKSPAAS